MDNSTNSRRVEELWFEDGNLVIQADTRCFRVYRGVLGAQSPVFRDMLPQPADSETIEGCPVVRLPDSEGDVACFLRAIFDSSFFEPHPAETDLITVVSILRRGNKYAVDYLRRRALVHLSSGFPVTLAEYDKGLGLSSILDVRNGPDDGPSILTISIARETDSLWILPSAFYTLATTANDAIEQTLAGVPHETHFATLSEEDQIVFLKSSLRISRANNDIVRFLHFPESIIGCVGNCSQPRLRALGKVQESLRIGHVGADPLGICDIAGIWTDLNNTCCSFCTKAFKQALRENRQIFWDTLPEMCGLPSWEAPGKMKEQALNPM
ncbi:hypothetical protein DFH06DRAFT_1467891 [Mycena polygramma]|nr:hypothetical protein DFH06DRAFT_1467891 [Mycena polygramma]